MKEKMIRYYMDIAKRTAKLSYCKRLQVGAIIVKEDRIISIGYNGTASGTSNNCEDFEFLKDKKSYDPEEYKDYPFKNSLGLRYKLITKPEVLHAEENAIGKLAKGHESGKGATMFITHAPCLNCAKTILVSGISTIFYNNIYRSNAGIKFLNDCGLSVIHYK